MSRAHAQHLLTALAVHAGSPLTLNDGLCALVDEHGKELANIEVPSPGDVVFVHALIADHPHKRDHQQILQLNFKPDQLGGCWLALDARNNLRLCAQQDLDLLDERGFSQWIFGFVERLASLRANLAS